MHMLHGNLMKPRKTFQSQQPTLSLPPSPVLSPVRQLVNKSKISLLFLLLFTQSIKCGRLHYQQMNKTIQCRDGAGGHPENIHHQFSILYPMNKIFNDAPAALKLSINHPSINHPLSSGPPHSRERVPRSFVVWIRGGELGGRRNKSPPGQ